MIIKELMVQVLVCVGPNEMFSSVLSLMREKALSCILVSENENPIGIITERDVVSFFANVMFNVPSVNPHFQDITASDVMTIKPVCVNDKTSLYDALLLARSRSLRHLLVVDKNEKLVGLVTQTNMANAYVELLQRQTKLETENQNLQLLSHEDSLMKIGNRRAMEVELGFADALAKRYKKTYAIALIDVDLFKKYNDHYGHQAGDDALAAIANAIKSSMRETDKLFRYGGEEILLLLPETRGENAFVSAERARQTVQDLQLPHSESPFDRVSISIGVASDQGEGWRALVARADKALYIAKESGRDKVNEADK